MANINGTAVNFGFTGTNGIAITTPAALAGILLLQSVDYSVEADKEEVRNGVGDIVSRAYYDQHYKAMLEFVITGTGLGAALTNTTLSPVTPGTIVTIGTCASVPELVATTWEVMPGASIKGSNTNAKRLSLPLEKRAGITGAAGA